MINKINNNSNYELFKKLTNEQQQSARKTDLRDSLQINSAELMEKVNQAQSDSSSAVQKAQQLLLSGKLDSPENIQKAAENIADFGI